MKSVSGKENRFPFANFLSCVNIRISRNELHHSREDNIRIKRVLFVSPYLSNSCRYELRKPEGRYHEIEHKKINDLYMYFFYGIVTFESKTHEKRKWLLVFQYLKILEPENKEYS